MFVRDPFTWIIVDTRSGGMDGYYSGTANSLDDILEIKKRWEKAFGHNDFLIARVEGDGPKIGKFLADMRPGNA